MEIFQEGDYQVKQKLLEVGMPLDIIESLFKSFRKQVFPQPKGYPTTAEITRILVSNSYTSDLFINDNIEQAKMAVLGNLVKEKTIPWYWLGGDLAKDLLLCDPPSAIPQQNVLPNHGIIVLPQSLIQTSTGEPNFIAYQLFRASEKSEINTLVRESLTEHTQRAKLSTEFTGTVGHRLCWCAFEQNFIYGGIVGLIDRDGIYKIEGDINLFCENPELEKKETNLLLSILLSTLTYVDCNESSIERNLQSIGFGKKANSKKSRLTPIFIGKSYKSQLPKDALFNIQQSAKKGTPKRIHWRKGHWRRIAIGKGKTQRAWRFFPPQLIGARNPAFSK